MEELNEKIDGLTMSAEVSAENDSDEMSFGDLGLDEITLKAIE